jgi:site-specific DNA recombinase
MARKSARRGQLAGGLREALGNLSRIDGLPAKLRCAVYTRKSSEEGLDMDFNSLEAQRESSEAYVASQKAEGWVLVPDRDDDGGFSGGSLERPALQRLLGDVKAGKVDVIVVYKD